MTTINFQCAACDGDFEVDMIHLLERPGAIKCPHCGNRPQAHKAQQFAQGLEDLLTAMAALRSKVRFELSLDSDALPPPYGGEDDGEGGLGPLGDDEDEEAGSEEEDAIPEVGFDEDGEFDEDEDDEFDDDDEEEEEEDRF